MTSVEAYIPFDLRERLAEIIKVIDKIMEDAVVAECERCAAVARDFVYRKEWGVDASLEAEATIRKGE